MQLYLHLAVTDCYGVPYIPEGQWLCRKCTVSPEIPVVRYSFLKAQPMRSSPCSRVSCVRTRVVPLNRRSMENGCIFYAPFGFQRRASPMMCSWSLSRVLTRYRSSGGSWYVIMILFVVPSLNAFPSQKCNICDIREGACIQCAKTSCFLAFHTTCARKERLLLAMKSTQGSEPVSLTCYCERHLPVCDNAPPHFLFLTVFG